MAEGSLNENAGVLLAVESATSRLSVALRLADGSVVERAPERPGQHAEAILPLVDRVLAEGGCGPSDPAAFAVSIGPGSFTSLRVGLATVKGLAFATSRRIAPVPTLEALALAALREGEEGPVAALLDARRGDVYAAVFAPPDPAGGAARLRCLVPDGLFTPGDLADVLPGGCCVVGEGAGIFEDALGGAPSGVRVRTDEATRWPRAAHVAELGQALLDEDDAATSPEIDLAPRYVRRAEAEAKRVDSEVEDPA